MREIDKQRVTMHALSGKRVLLKYLTMREAKSAFIEYARWLLDRPIPTGIGICGANGNLHIDFEMCGSVRFDTRDMDGVETYELGEE